MPGTHDGSFLHYARRYDRLQACALENQTPRQAQQPNLRAAHTGARVLGAHPDQRALCVLLHLGNCPIKTHCVQLRDISLRCILMKHHCPCTTKGLLARIKRPSERLSNRHNSMMSEGERSLRPIRRPVLRRTNVKSGAREET